MAKIGQRIIHPFLAGACTSTKTPLALQVPAKGAQQGAAFYRKTVRFFDKLTRSSEENSAFCYNPVRQRGITLITGSS